VVKTLVGAMIFNSQCISGWVVSLCKKQNLQRKETGRFWRSA